METQLNFEQVISRSDLVPISVYSTIELISTNYGVDEFLVAEIDLEFAGGLELCAKYNIDPKCGANCLIVEGKRGGTSTLVACLVPVGFRYDMSGVVRKKLNARQVSLASLEFVISQIGMEYGSITPIGLPADWKIFIDPQVLETDRLIIGGGLKKSKLSIPSKALLNLPGAEILPGLAKKMDSQ